jgi:dienelactone hydrolase
MLAAAVRLEDLQKPFGLFVCEGTRHAFHNDAGANSDAAAARDAWSRTSAFLNKYLS